MIRKINYFTLMEIMVATAIIGTMILGVIEFMSAQQRYINDNKDKKYALLKANQMLNELRTYLEDSGETSGNADTLDRLSNRKPSPLLTVMPLPKTAMSDYAIVLSNNTKRDVNQTHLSSWKYLRTIQVAPIGIGGTRQVTVKIYRGKDFANFPADNLTDPLSNGYYPKPIISLITVLPTIGDIDFEAQQVFDYYNIAIENVPGWWVHMSELLPVAQSAIDYIDSVNDGMTIRNHWITKMGFGRDRFYAPYLNIVKDSYQSVENAYFYPGKLPPGFAKPNYYVPSLMKCHMQSDYESPTTAISYINGYNPYFTSEMLLLDPTAITSAYKPYNPHPYAPADYLNNPMRYADTKHIYDQRNYEAKRAWFHKNIDRNPEKNPGLLEISREDDVGFANNEDYFTRIGQGEEMPWSLLLDELSMNPEKFRNAIFLNLHGELLPMPPVRNYSDAAFSSTGVNIKRKTSLEVGYDAGQYDFFRVVTHPEKIRYHAKNKPGVAFTTDEVDNIDTQNPFLRVYGYLSEPIRSGAWRSAGANNADGSSGVKKARLDDVEESPITVSIRFHKSTYSPTGDNSDFDAWRELLTSAVNTMRNDRYVSFYEGGVNDLNNRLVYYGTNYTSAIWGSFMAGSSIDIPTEANEGWGYLNHALDSADANKLKAINTDGFMKKGLGVEPLGLKYAPYFFLDYSLDPTKNLWNNVMYFHQRDSNKIHYNTADDALADASDLGLNVNYVVGATSATDGTHVPNNIIKAAGALPVVTTLSNDILLSGFSNAKITNPAGWTPHFIGVKPDATIPTTEPAKGESEWFANYMLPGMIASALSNGCGYMKFWTGTHYDDFKAAYHSFPKRYNLRSLGLLSADSLLGETSPNYWHFGLVGPDPLNGKYEMLYLSDKDWVPLQAGLNYPACKLAWDDSMNWSISGTKYVMLDASKTLVPTINSVATGLVGTGKFLITNYTDDFTISSYFVMTTVIPGESSGIPYVPAKGMVIGDKRITSVLRELDPNDPLIGAAFKTVGLVGARFFQVTLSSALTSGNTATTLVIPKVGIGETVVAAGAVLDFTTAFYKPAVGMKVYDSTGTNFKRIVSIQNYTEPVVGVGIFATSPAATIRVTLDSAFAVAPATVYLVAQPAIQSTPIGNEMQPLAFANPQKRGMVVYADSKLLLDSYVASVLAGDPNFVKYGVVKEPAGSDVSSAVTKVYRLDYTGGVMQWIQQGTVGRKLSYTASNFYWNRIPCYDRMWAEIEYGFIHSPMQNKWVPKEIIGSDKTFTGDHCIIITLHNTPMTTPSEASTTANLLMTGLTNAVGGMSGGLLRNVAPTATFTNDRRLFQLEYIPCAIRDSHKPTGGLAGTATNTLDLLSQDKLAKNTARWRIKIPSRTQMAADILVEQGAARVREAGVPASKSITMSASTKAFFNTFAGQEGFKNSMMPLVFETRMGGLLTAEWSNILGKSLNVVVGSNTDYTGVGAPAAVSEKYGYFKDVYKDIADWSLWAKINEANYLLNDDCRTHNNSRTFTWVVNNTADYPNIGDDIRIPFSEKSQTYGDPRHMPYSDLKDNGAGSNKGYNWYFNNITATNNWADYTGFSKVKSGYTTGPYEADIPKLFMWLREGMVNANTLWCSITGYSNYYVGLGNEIGYDSANGFNSSIPVHLKPWGVNASNTGYEDSILDSVIGIKNRSGTWEARNFLGELFPDSEYTNFTKTDTDASKSGGSLVTGYTAASDVQYYRFNRENSKYLEIATMKAIRRTSTFGSSSFLNIESSVVAGQKFNHTSQVNTNTGTIATTKNAMLSDAFHVTFDTNLYSNRPWIVTEAANVPPEWADYTAWRKEGLLVDFKVTPGTVNTLMDMVLYRDNSNRIASGLLEIHDKGATSDRGIRKKALFMINGLSQMNISGANSISTYSVMSLLYGFLRGGSKRFNPNIFPGAGTLVTKDDEPAFVRQLPKINIISPKITFPITESVCQIKWTVQWRRWDGKPYWGNNNAATDPDYWKTEYAEPTPDGSIFFRVIYSEAPHTATNDWRYVVKPDVKTSAGITYDKLIDDNEGYPGSLQDVVEIDGDEVYGGTTQPGREFPAVAASPWQYRCDWKLDNLMLKTAYAIRVECHRRQHTMYYIDGAGVEKAYENDANAINNAKAQRKYMHSHYSFQQGLMIKEE